MTHAAWSILVRCEGSPAIGFGHVFRSLALAKELAERGASVSFAMRDGAEGIALVKRQGHSILPADADALPASPQWLSECAERSHADALVLDIRDSVPRSAIEALRDGGLLVATLDDPTDRRLASDLAFYPPVPQVREFDWSGFSGSLLVGSEWVVLRREFAEPPDRPSHAHPRVLVTMGGSDPAGMTLTAIDALGTLPGPLEITVVVGPGYGDRAGFDARIAQLNHPVTPVDQPADMRTMMMDATLAVASFGVTAYELAATATPAILLCLTDDHARSASVFHARGAAISLGVYTGTERQPLADAIRILLADQARRAAMSDAGRSFIDGRGAGRVADRIIAALQERKRTRELK